ncbi:hypothetical protein BC830DRAFT_71826 [Chytriomyces sp. MP71]|nr:hypothetical protein BC830DRAFT_71826 [Chytriomyces sp. MP71]
MATPNAAPLARLDYLNLVNRIASELVNHTGISDKTLAEFVVALHAKSRDYASFAKKLRASGAEFPDTFVATLDRIVLQMRPSDWSEWGLGGSKKSAAAKSRAAKRGNTGGEGTADLLVSLWDKEDDDEFAQQKRVAAAKFPGLAMKDDRERARELVVADLATTAKQVKGELGKGKDAMETMDELDALLREKRKEADDRDAFGRDRRDRGDRERSRSRSPRRRDYRGPDGGRHRDDDRDSRRDRDRHRNSSSLTIDDAPVLYKIYTGKVSNLRDFGAFVQLDGIRGGRVEGMVHIGSLTAGPARVTHPSDVVQRNQKVFVKVMSIAGNRIGLSMKDVDQETGKDLSPQLRVRTHEEMMQDSLRNPERPVITSFSEVPIVDDVDTHSAAVKRISSPERWEIKQLIASGVLNPKDYPNIDDDNGLLNYEEKEEELDIEIVEEEPMFLKGQTKNSIQLSPIKIVKNPDGSLNRAALQGASLAKERREIRQQQAAAEADSVAHDLNRSWVDPMAAPSERQFSQDVRGSGQEQTVAEWKKATFNNATTFGRITSLSIKEQRESLPIFKLRDELVRAVDGNQVMIVVGDTGSGKVSYSLKSFHIYLEFIPKQRRHKWRNTLRKKGFSRAVCLDAHSHVAWLPCLSRSVSQRKLDVGWVRKLATRSALKTARVPRQSLST